MRTRVAVVAFLLAAVLLSQLTGRGTGQPSDPTAALMARAQAGGAVRVIVHLQAPFVPEQTLATPAHISAQRANIARLRADVRASLRGVAHNVVREYDALPFIALEVGPDALRMLGALPGMVDRVEEDALAAPMLAESVPLIQGDQAWAAGFDGTGQIVVILDTGVDKNHPFL